MKRNGFTLVELLAVIALVGVLAVIGVATYTNVNESAKQKTLEAKKEQIRSSAIKWAKENNITNKTIISVNALVVEGYLTADENRVGEIGLIENPVNGDNMICNTVDISFKDGNAMAEVNDTVQNCDLATQSLTDNKINVTVIDADGHNKSGGTNSSISSWTNENVMLVVSSTEYDRDAVSISYDFEGNTKVKNVSGLQKYTGNGYLDKDTAELYYNVFNIDANLLLNNKVIVSYTLTDGTVKSRAYTIRIDKEEATASAKDNNEWLTTDKPIYVLVDDGKGSGPKYFYVTKSTTEELKDSNKYNANNFEGTATNLEVGKYYIWTEDNAGNRSTKPKLILEINNIDKTVPECEVVFNGTLGDHGWYKESQVKVSAKNSIPASISGFNIGVNDKQNDPTYSVFANYNTYNETPAIIHNTNTSRSGYDYYCHVKTLAGNYNKNRANLKLDMTPPTVTVDITSDTNYTERKMISVTSTDNLSGIPSETNVRYRWLRNDGNSSNWYTNTMINTNPGSTGSISSSFHTPYDLTGIYTLQIDVSQVVDYAGNHARGVNGGGTPTLTEFGPFYFDNTPPQCADNNGKTNWTSGSYTINQYCKDEEGTPDQSGCTQNVWRIPYTTLNNVKSDYVIIEDKLGHTTRCDYDVYLDNINPTCTLTPSTRSWTNQDVTMTLSTNDNLSGIPSEYPPFVWSFPFSQNGNTTSTGWTSLTTRAVGYNGTVSVTIKDRANNQSTCSYAIANIDKEAPTCTGTIGGYDKTTGITYTVTCNDTGGSGCSSGFGTHGTYAPVGSSETHSYSVSDVAGNTTGCGTIYVWSQKQAQVRTCSSPKRCQSAGCETYKSCTTFNCGSTETHYSGQNPSCSSGCLFSGGNSLGDGQDIKWKCNCPKTCRNSSCGCETYKASCESCGCSAYDTVNQDWHDESFCSSSKTNCNLTECRWVFRASKQ